MKIIKKSLLALFLAATTLGMSGKVVKMTLEDGSEHVVTSSEIATIDFG